MSRFTRALVLGFLVATLPATGQLVEVSLESRVDDAALIVEATVIGKTPFWNPDRTRILTANRLRVHKVLKLSGQRLDDVAELDLLTLGGTIGGRRHDVQPELNLETGRTGIFFIERREAFAGLAEVWLPLTGPQGFVRYDEIDGTAHDPFRSYADREQDLYRPVRARTGQPYIALDATDPAAPAGTQRGGVGPVITGFSPNPVSGGVMQVLTIDGTGFGSIGGSATVFFDDPDDGPGGSFSSITALHVVNWTDTQIQVLVPGEAGTGSFIVRDSSGVDGVSPSALTIDYALSEIFQSQLYRVFHEDEDDRGGFTLKHSTATVNNGVAFNSVPDAVDRFDEALALWRCATGWTAEVDGTTTVNSPSDDGINIVAFDHNGDPLPGGVLGRATSYYTGCGSPQQWHVQGVDIRFRRDGFGVDWFFGADTGMQMFSEHDFMSVAAHETGHAVQHRHVNNAGDMMFWSIANGASARTLTAANISAGQDIMGFSVGNASACATGMRAFSCSSPPTARFAASPLGACGTSATVDFTDLSYDGPTSWDWSFGDTNASTVRNPSHNYGSPGVYDVSLDVSNAAGVDSASASSFIVVTNAAAATCDPTFAGHQNGFNMGPTRVTLNTIDHVTQTSQNEPLQEDFSCSLFTVLEPSTPYALDVATGGTNAERVRAYIDWDNDGTLTASEVVMDSTGGGDFHSATVNVPASPAMDTALRLRVLSDWAGTDLIDDPCENIEYGQVEDYSVLVRAAVAAVPGVVPDDSLRVDKTGPTTVVLTWDPSCGAGAADYSIYQGTLGDWTSHTQKVCSTSGNTFRTIGTGTPSRYFLVVPFSATAEGSYGTDSNGLERPVGLSTCAAVQDATACP